MSGFPHQRLKAYDVAQELAVRARRLSATLPRGSADLRDQLNRASHSVARLIAEGANRWTAADKMARFVLAQGEAGECDTILETIGRLEFADEAAVAQLRNMANHVGALLTGLIRRQKSRMEEGG